MAIPKDNEDEWAEDRPKTEPLLPQGITKKKDVETKSVVLIAVSQLSKHHIVT